MQLLSWYKNNARVHLPWRKTTDAYRVYISEIMLQQTQVARVQNEYYPRFLQRFATLKSVANAQLEEVFALWSGLGYYRRAENLHKCAKECGGVLPKNYKELIKLPGIGSYTASAICSFAYNQTISVVDTNIQRVLCRFFALKEVKPKELQEVAERFLNLHSPKEHNLALMDLGSGICSVTNPACTLCPLQSACLGKKNPQEFTSKKSQKRVKLELFYGLYIKNGKIALCYSTENMYKNMLLLPQVEPIDEEFVANYRHAYTKYDITVNLYRVAYVPQEVLWFDLQKLSTLPIPSLVKKALVYIEY